MAGSERSSPEALLKKEASPAVPGGGENSGDALASDALNYRDWGLPSRTLKGNSRKSSESVSEVFPEFSGIAAATQDSGKTVLGQASSWNHFWKDFLEVWVVPKQTS